MKKITYNGQMRNEHFLIVMYHSSLAKAAVNGLHICKLRRDHLTCTGHGVTVFVVPL
jgi:hypothetical protein